MGYRKVVVEVCRADLDRLTWAVREAMGKTPGSIAAEVAEGVVMLLQHAYERCVDDDHDQVEPEEYDAAERWFSKGRTDVHEVYRRGRGVVGVIFEGGDPRNDHYQYTEPAFGRGWREIPDLIGRETLGEVHHRQETE